MKLLFRIANIWEAPRCPSAGDWKGKLRDGQTVECSLALEMSYRTRKRHGKTLNALALSEKGNLRRLRAVGFQLQDILEKAKVRGR